MDNTSSQEVFVLARGGGPTLTYMGAKIAYKVRSAESSGAWALLEHTLPPHFEGMPLHWHKVTRTGFYVLEGRVALKTAAQAFTIDAGGFASVPPHTLHTFSNEQDQPARMLEIILPGGSENYFKELIALSQDLSSGESQELSGLHRRYDMFMPDELE